MYEESEVHGLMYYVGQLIYIEVCDFGSVMRQLPSSDLQLVPSCWRVNDQGKCAREINSNIASIATELGCNRTYGRLDTYDTCERRSLTDVPSL
jgi:hypothetical protein